MTRLRESTITFRLAFIERKFDRAGLLNTDCTFSDHNQGGRKTCGIIYFVLSNPLIFVVVNAFQYNGKKGTAILSIMSNSRPKGTLPRASGD